MASNKGKSVATVVQEIAAPIAEELNLILWDIRWLKEGSDWHLHIYLDKEGGVSLNDCEEFYHIFNPLLDERDPIPHQYQLEIESPGIERALTKDFHFQSSVGKEIRINLIRPDESGTKVYTGELVSYDNGIICIDIDGELRQFEKKLTAGVNVCYREEDDIL